MARKKEIEIRYYDSTDVVQYKYQGPTMPPEEYEALKANIAENGMRHPVFIRWDEYTNRFTPRVGNNRIAMLAELGETHARAVILGPVGSPFPTDKHEVLPFDKNLITKMHELWPGYAWVGDAAKTAPWRIILELAKIHKL